MLRKMLLQGLAAAALVGGAAVVYAQAQDNGYLPAPQAKTVDNPTAKQGVREHAGARAEHGRDRARGERHGGDDD